MLFKYWSGARCQLGDGMSSGGDDVPEDAGLPEAALGSSNIPRNVRSQSYALVVFGDTL